MPPPFLGPLAGLARISAAPHAVVSEGDGEISSGSWTALHVRAALYDPGGSGLTMTFGSASDAFRFPETVGPTKRLSRLNHAAHTLPVYASIRRSPNAPQHSVRDGGQPSRAGLAPARAATKASMFYIIFLLPRLGLAHRE